MSKLKIVTYNIRCLYGEGDGSNSFIHRAGMILDKIRNEMPDVICFQEVSNEIRGFLNKYLVDYVVVGHGRLADYSGEGLSIAYRKDGVELFSLDHFWLSETPHIPASRYGNQSKYPRICPCAVLKHKNIKTPFRLYNVHLDHIGEDARVLGIRQIIKTAASENEIMALPTLILGDFNAYPDSETVRYCDNNDIYPLKDLTKGIESTYHAFKGDDAPEPCKIDYIYADVKTSQFVESVYLWKDKRNGIYLSDHYPVCCELELD